MIDRIVPLNLGMLEVDKSLQMSLCDIGKSIWVACIAWYLEGNGTRILIDSGPADKEWSEKYHRKLQREKNNTLRESLKKVGVSPEEISLVINTHLHWDHCYGNSELRNADIIVQRDELMYAIAPYSRDSRMYEADLGSPAILGCLDRIRTVDGDKTIISGIDVIKTPGHTPGSQGVAVETRKGVYFLAGDTFGLYENLEFSPPWPPGIFVDLGAFYRSAEKVLKIADYILPGHDPAVFEKQSYP